MTSTTFFFVFIPILAIILLAVNLIFAPHNSYEEKDSAFECGFHSFLGQNRTQFSISFFIFALLFLLFDLEILLVYPYVVSAHTNGIYGLAIMLIFFLALTLGFAFELGKNALKIDSKQMFVLNINKAFSISSTYHSVFGLIIYNLLSNPKVIIYRFVIMFIISILLRYLFFFYLNVPLTTFDMSYLVTIAFTGASLTELYILLPSPLALYNYFIHNKPLFDGLKLPTHFAMDAGPSGESSKSGEFSKSGGSSNSGLKGFRPILPNYEPRPGSPDLTNPANWALAPPLEGSGPRINDRIMETIRNFKYNSVANVDLDTPGYPELPIGTEYVYEHPNKTFRVRNDGFLIVQDIGNASYRGFKQENGELYPTYKSYNKTLSSGMAFLADAVSRTGGTSHIIKFDLGLESTDRIFLEDFMKHKYPNRPAISYRNSRGVRSALEDLP